MTRGPVIEVHSEKSMMPPNFSGCAATGLTDSSGAPNSEPSTICHRRSKRSPAHADARRTRVRPLTLAPGLADSPTGLLAWILEKYRSWSDCDGDLSSRFTDDFLLTQASLYWFTNTIASSFRPYWEFATGWTERVDSVSAPTAVAVFPHDLAQPPRSWAERTYNVVRYSTMPRGGHFAPHEEPELLTADIRDFLRPLR